MARQDSMKVLAPWTPIKYQTNALHLWGRDYELASSALPRQITSSGKSLLAGPITFECWETGKTLPATLGRLTTVLALPEEVKLRGGFSLGDHIGATITLRAEYDGLLVYHIHLNSARGVRIDKCSLEIPVKNDVASYFQKYILMNNDWGKQATHTIPSGQGVVWHSPFNPDVWIGNPDNGLLWFSQSAVDWHTASDPLRFVRSGDHLKFIVSFINVW